MENTKVGTGLSEKYAAADLARILGVTRRGLNKRAKKEKWLSEVDEGNGGLRYLFPRAGLPADVKRAVEAHELKVSSEQLAVSREQGAVSSSTGFPACDQSSVIPPSPLYQRGARGDTPLEKGGEGGQPGGDLNRWLAAPERERQTALARLAVLRVQNNFVVQSSKFKVQSRTILIKEFYGRLNMALRGATAGDQATAGGGCATSVQELLSLGFREHEIPEVVARIKKVSWQTAYRWQGAWAEARQAGEGSGAAGLTRGYGDGPGLGTRTISPDMTAFVRSLIVKGDVKLYPNDNRRNTAGGGCATSSGGGCATSTAATGPLVKVNRALVHRRVRENFLTIPHPAHFTRWLNSYLLEKGEELAAICLPSWWRGNMQPKAGLAAEGAEYFGQWWEMDGTRADVMLNNGRHEIIAAVDVFSRDALVEVEKDATSLTVAKLLRQGILTWGVPQTLTTDRGLIFKSKHIQAACAHLGVDLDLCDGYAPWQKPHVEAFFGSLTRVLFEALPWYIGHNPAQRKRIEEYNRFQQCFYHRRGVKLACDATADDLRQVLEDWLAKVYRTEAHRFADCKLGRSPLVWERQANSPQRAGRVENPEFLDLLLAPAIPRTFDSGISWEKIAYQPDSEEAWQAAQRFALRPVIFKPDLADISKGTLWERREGDGGAGAFICRVDSRLRGGLDLDEYMRAKGRIIKAHKRRRRDAEGLTGVPGYDRELARMPMPKVAVGGFGQPAYDGEAYRALQDYDDRVGLRLVPDEKRTGEILRGAAALEQARLVRAQSLEDLQATPESLRYEALICREAKGELIVGDDAQFMRFFEAADEFRLLEEHFRKMKMQAATEIWRE